MSAEYLFLKADLVVDDGLALLAKRLPNGNRSLLIQKCSSREAASLDQTPILDLSPLRLLTASAPKQLRLVLKRP